MNVYFDSPRPSRCIGRVVTQLEKHLPQGLQRVQTEEQADLIVLHAIGRNFHITSQAQGIIKSGKQYAVIQYALKSTRNPNPKDWYTLWHGARVVWSYYDLREYMDNFYHAPFGADSELFHPQEMEKEYIVGTLGNPQSYKVECFGEVHLAAFQTGGRAIHIGEQFGANPRVKYVQNIDDQELRAVYNSCKWFATIRRKEGFEMPAVEAMLCGTRPILFDTPNYRQWFDDLAVFIPEAESPKVLAHLRAIFKKKPEPLKKKEIETVSVRFAWKRLIEGFWQKCMI